MVSFRLRDRRSIVIEVRKMGVFQNRRIQLLRIFGNYLKKKGLRNFVSYLENRNKLGIEMK